MVARRTLPALACISALAQADIVMLKDGSVLEGTVRREGKYVHVEDVESSQRLSANLVERIVPTDDRVKRAEELIANKRLLKALNTCSEAIEENPRDIEALRTRAEIYLRMGLAPKAASDLERALEAGSRSIRTMRLLEEACWKARKPDKLAELLRAALAKRPSDRATRLRLIAALRARHKYKEAMGCARNGLELDPFDLKLALCHEEMRARVEAAPAIRTVRTLHYTVLSWETPQKTRAFAAQLEGAYGTYARFFGSGTKAKHVARFFPKGGSFERWCRKAYDRRRVQERARASMRDAGVARALRLLTPFGKEIWAGAAGKWLAGPPDPDNVFRALGMIEEIGKAYERGERARAEALVFELLKLASSSPEAAQAPAEDRKEPAGGGISWLGFYVPADKELILWDYGKELFRTVKHEALHQFLDSQLYNPPIWFNEGLATFFEYSQAGELALNPVRLQGLSQGMRMRQLVGLRELFLMEQKDFCSPLVISSRYAQAWSVVAFLCRFKQPNYLRSYFEALKKGLRKEEAYEEVFGPDCSRLEAMWREWAYEVVEQHAR